VYNKSAQRVRPVELPKDECPLCLSLRTSKFSKGRTGHVAAVWTIAFDPPGNELKTTPYV
jgi:hypothetical protein